MPNVVSVSLGNNLCMNLSQIRLALCIAVSVVAHLLFFSELLAGLPADRTDKPAPLDVRLSLLSASDRLIDKGNSAPPGGAALLRQGNSVQLSSSATKVSADEPSLFLLPVEDYLPASLLTELPSAIDSVDPTPPGFEFNGVVGEIELMLLISSEGNVDNVLTISSGLPEIVVEYAKSAFRQARFRPGKVQNTAVRSRSRVVLAPPPAVIDPETGHPLSAKYQRR